jgi:hypothetical protein
LGVAAAAEVVTITIRWDARDIWLGIYWNVAQRGCTCLDYFATMVEGVERAQPHWHRELSVYVCLLPMLPIRFRWRTAKGVA